MKREIFRLFIFVVKTHHKTLYTELSTYVIRVLVFGSFSLCGTKEIFKAKNYSELSLQVFYWAKVSTLSHSVESKVEAKEEKKVVNKIFSFLPGEFIVITKLQFKNSSF